MSKEELKDKVIIITGGTKGIGLGLAEDFIKVKSKIAIFARNIELFKQKINGLQKKYNNSDIICLPVNVGIRSEVAKAINQVLQDWEKIDVLINNAGVGWFERFEHLNDSQIEEMIKTNLYGLINCVKEVLPNMIARKDGVIINISSMSGIDCSIGETIYGATKSAVIGFTKALAKEVKDYNITVSAVCPGPVDTTFSNDRNRVLDERLKIKVEQIAEIIMKLIGESSQILQVFSRGTSRIEHFLTRKSSCLEFRRQII